MGMGRFMNQGDFSIKGYSSHDAMTEFVDGTYKITNGSMFDQDDSTKKCIISSETHLGLTRCVRSTTGKS